MACQLRTIVENTSIKKRRQSMKQKRSLGVVLLLGALLAAGNSWALGWSITGSGQTFTAVGTIQDWITSGVVWDNDGDGHFTFNATNLAVNTPVVLRERFQSGTDIYSVTVGGENVNIPNGAYLDYNMAIGSLEHFIAVRLDTDVALLGNATTTKAVGALGFSFPLLSSTNGVPDQFTIPPLGPNSLDVYDTFSVASPTLVSATNSFATDEARIPTPEPATFILFGAGLGGLALLRRKARK
jgi:hypothetical protein